MISRLSLLPIVLACACCTAALADGAQRVYFRRDGSLMMFDVARGDVRALWPQRSPGEVDPPAVSPDGKTVYFSQDGNLWALTEGQAVPRRLTDSGAPPTEAGADLLALAEAVSQTRSEAARPIRCDQPLPSPDGDWLAYRTVANDGGLALRLLNLRDGADVQLAQVDRFDACWAPDGAIVYTSAGQLWRRLPPDAPAQPLVSAELAPLPHSAPRFDAQGRLCFISAGQPLLRWPDGRIEPAASADRATAMLPGPSQWLAIERRLTAQTDQHTELLVVGAGGAKPRLVVSTADAKDKSDGGHVRPVGWLSDSRLLVVRDLFENSRKLYAVNPNDSRAELVFKGQDRDSGFVLWVAS